MTTSKHPHPPTELNGRHRHTYETIFRHPAAHNLEWHDVQSLLAALGEVVEGKTGSFQVSRNGHTVILHAPKHKDIATVEGLLAIRHFLEKSAEPASAPSVVAGAHMLVVIEHHEAQIYRTEMQGTVPQQLVPLDPHGFRRHLHSSGNVETAGHREPERKSFYDAVAKTLRGAEQVLLFGSGTGESSAMDQLLADLKEHHHDVADKVIGSILIDAKHTTEPQLLAKAREFYAKHNEK
ncbi:hypothetical protein BH10PLA2_BH10PLA2_17120 [soil metagenome]